MGIEKSKKQNASNEEDLRLPATLRLRLEEVLGESVGRTKNGFEAYFDRSSTAYVKYLRQAINRVLVLDNNDYTREWFISKGIDIVTWHYQTRQPVYQATYELEWISGQAIFKKTLRRFKDLEPFPGKKSPYIGIYANEKSREEHHVGGPICVALPGTDTDAPEDWKAEWKYSALIVPPRASQALKIARPHEGDEGPLRSSDLSHFQQKAPGFAQQLFAWMSEARGTPTKGTEAFNHLLASLKVTLQLVSRPKYRCQLPRSTFLCPAYVAGEEIGGMAFACEGFVSRRTALIGEALSNAILTYIRLREDALAHRVAEEREKLDQVKSYFMQRVAHDVRHPIESLQSAVKDARKTMSSIDEQIGHVIGVMNATMLVIEGRDPREVLAPKKRPDDVSEFFADIEYFFSKQFQQKGKHFTVGYINKEWVFRIDRGLLHEAMANLISNALEHGGQEVRVDVDKEKDWYLIHVRDNGQGIPARDRENIFKPFFKKSMSLRRGRIRGRGLAFARMLVEDAHKGRLTLEAGDEEWKTHFLVKIPAN